MSSVTCSVVVMNRSDITQHLADQLTTWNIKCDLGEWNGCSTPAHGTVAVRCGNADVEVYGCPACIAEELASRPKIYRKTGKPVRFRSR